MDNTNHNPGAPLRPITYPIPARALDKWWKFDIKRRAADGGATHYIFRYLGSTCTNCGKPIETRLQAVLRPEAAGMRVERAWIEFDEDDEGHVRMCEYSVRGKELVEELARPAAFCGQTLEAAIEGMKAVNPAGCFCDPTMVTHKWRQMLCAIHYGLTREEEARNS